MCLCLLTQSVRAIGRCAVSIEKAAERCINVLLELIQSKVNYVVQEAIIVIKVRHEDARDGRDRHKLHQAMLLVVDVSVWTSPLYIFYFLQAHETVRVSTSLIPQRFIRMVHLCSGSGEVLVKYMGPHKWKAAFLFDGFDCYDSFRPINGYQVSSRRLIFMIGSTSR